MLRDRRDGEPESVGGVREPPIRPGMTASSSDARTQTPRANGTVDDAALSGAIQTDEGMRIAKTRAGSEQVLHATQITNTFLAHSRDKGNR
jgi:hypothetical protein